MNKLKTKKLNELRDIYEDVCNEYARRFCEKQDMAWEGWVADQVGTVACCSDFFFNFEDIKLDLQYSVKKGEIIDWYYGAMDDNVNYYAHVKGFRKNKKNKP